MFSITEVRDKPFVRLLLPYLAGVWAGYYFPISEKHILVFLCILLVLMLLNLLYAVYKSYLFKYLDFSIYISLLIFGYLNTVQIMEVPTISNSNENWIGVVQDVSGNIKTYKKIVVRTKPLLDIGNDCNESFLVQIITPNDSITSKLQVSDCIRFSTEIKKTGNPGNPYEFDYASYLLRKGIFYTAFLKSGSVQWISETNKFPLKAFANRVRSRVVEQIEKYPFGESEKAIVYALTLGYKDYLSDEIKVTYSNAGAIHILAVSGLHLGILYMIFSFILLPLDKNRYTRILRLILLLLIIWSFALLTGFSPSVVRASLMFSVYAFGNSLTRKANSYNNLALAAFIMLLINPLLIWDAGFLLSFSAVWGILFFQPRFDSFFSIRSWFIKYLYQLVSISFAAQLGTFVFVIYYFNKFPVYFWLANILVIPLVFLILCFTILFLIISFIVPEIMIVGEVLNYLLTFLNYWVMIVVELPGAVISNICFSLPGLIIMSIAIVILGSLFGGINYRNLRLMLYSLILFLSVEIASDYYKQNSRQLVFYNASKGICIAIHLSDSTSLFVDGFYANPEAYEWIAFSDLLHRGSLDKLKVMPLYTLTSGRENAYKTLPNYLLTLHNKTVYVLNNKLTENNLFTDYLYIASRNLKPDIELFSKVIPDCLILNSSVPEHNRKEWTDLANTLSIKVVDLSTSGALILNF